MSDEAKSPKRAKTTNLEGVLLGAGNPLLDISAVVKQETLDKYELKLNNAILAEDKHAALFEELIQKYKVEYIAGGATQNSIRVAQWMLQEPNCTSYFGCVGKDKYAEELRKCAETDGVAVLYQINEKVATGRCAVCVKDHERSMVASLGAAATFTIDHLKESAVEKVWKKASVLYSSGFFLTSSAESALFLAKHCHDTGKTFCMNLAAPFICEFFNKQLLDCMPYVDIIFGNESESQAFGKAMKYEDCSPKAVALKLAELTKANTSRPRVVVITQGASETIVVTGADKTLTTYKVPAVPSDEIVDANGAGDAFVGGYLSQLVRGKDIERCVAAAHYAAGRILRVSGTVLKGKPDFESSCCSSSSSCKTGSCQTGSCQTGSCQTGSCRTGSCKTGSCKTGSCKTGGGGCTVSACWVWPALAAVGVAALAAFAWSKKR